MASSRTLSGLTRPLTLCAALTGLVLFGGCVASYKGRQPPPPATTLGTTLGQELIDLKKARDEGAMTDEEYTVQRTRMLGDPVSAAGVEGDAL